MIKNKNLTTNKNERPSQFLKKNSLFLISIFALVSTTIILVWKSKVKEDQLKLIGDSEILTQVLIKASLRLQHRWESGDLEGHFVEKKFSCDDEIKFSENIDDQYLRCNPHYIQCYFSGKAGTSHPKTNIPIRFKEKNYQVKLKAIYPSHRSYSFGKRFYSIVTRSNTSGISVPDYGMMVTLEVEGFPLQSLTIILEDSCHDTFLPPRLYSYGSYKHTEWPWDNLHRGIFIDKFLVTFRDIIEWIDYGKGDRNISYPSDSMRWAEPAFGLTINQMRNYCGFRGKSLLEAHIFDAATFLPSDFEQPVPTFIVKGPYPWTRKRHVPHLTEDEKLTKEKCSLVYSYECLELFPRKFYSSLDATWIEMNQVLGGPIEYLRNPVHPLLNIKSSSFYFKGTSPWHQLGLRAQWDGKSFTAQNFNWKTDEIEVDEKSLFLLEPLTVENNQFQIGFRCMKFAEGEN